MHVRYSPEGGETQEWDFDPKQVRATHAELMEARYNAGRKDAVTWEQFMLSLQKGDAKARRVLLWHLLTLTHHTLRYEDTPDFRMGELVVEHSLSELRDMRERVEKSPLTEDQKSDAMFALDYQISEAMEREERGEETGKAQPQTSVNATGQRSRKSST